MRIALRLLRSKQKHGVFFPKKRRAFVLGLDWVERINRWLYCSRPQAHAEAPPGDAFSLSQLKCGTLRGGFEARKDMKSNKIREVLMQIKRYRISILVKSS